MSRLTLPNVKLYKDDVIPPARAVMMIAEELGLNLTYVDTSLFKREHLTPEFVKKNPLHSIPLLEDGDFVLSDSHAIAAYLVTVYGKDDSLYPKDPKKRATVDQRMHFDNGILYVRTRNITVPVWLFGKTETPQEKFDALEEAYGYLETYLNMNKWVAGDQITIADFCTVATLTASNMVLPLNKDKYPKTVTWWNKLSQRSSYKKYCEPGEIQLTDIYKTIQN